MPRDCPNEVREGPVVSSEARDTAAKQRRGRGATGHNDAKHHYGTITACTLEVQKKTSGGQKMKITSFNPQILTKDMESLAKLFEELGFEKKHNPTGIGEYDVSAIRMADASGFHVDLSEGKDTPIPHDMIVIRMNVDSFDEAYELLSSHGFKNFYGDKIVETRSFKSAIMIAPSGFAINLIEHIKK